MKKFASAILICFLFALLSACNDMKKIEPEKHFSGPQLTLAKAIQAADRESVLRLAKETDLNTPGNENLTLLFFALNEAIYNNNPPERLQIVTDLVKAGADPLQPQPTMPGSPAEMMAMGDKDIWLKALLDGGLDPNAKDKVLNEPIIFKSLDAKNTQTLELFIKRGANVNTQDSIGRTLLIDAFDSVKFDHINYLIAVGADVNLEDNLGWSFIRRLDRDLARSKPDSEYHHECQKIKDKINSLGIKR